MTLKTIWLSNVPLNQKQIILFRATKSICCPFANMRGFLSSHRRIFWLNLLYSFLHHLQALADVGDGVFGLLLILQREAALEAHLF